MYWGYHRLRQQSQTSLYNPYYQQPFPFPFLSPFPADRLEERLERLERQLAAVEVQTNRMCDTLHALERRVVRLEQRLTSKKEE
ncbi:hypothetical protein [Effusibacillus pohliae]|uniref:hypothetical protein n=1 Tax=Effusibacillus pohliae TaxID=232270 RepID=UPI0003751C59|nr:hypothetical protein [Effusibacillus pohliae]